MMGRQKFTSNPKTIKINASPRCGKTRYFATFACPRRIQNSKTALHVETIGAVRLKQSRNTSRKVA